MFSISKVLIVEKNTGESDPITESLQLHGLETKPVANAYAALEALQHQAPDFIAVLFSSAFTLREAFTEYTGLRAGSPIPVFIQVNPWESRRRMRDLKRQCAVYFVEAGNAEHLAKKLRYLTEPRSEPVVTLRISGLELIPPGRRLLRDGQEVHLTPREFMLLRCLMQTPDTAFTNSQLLYLVWETGDSTYSHSLQTHITSLRSKLGPYGACIVSVRKVGYLFRSPNHTFHS